MGLAPTSELAEFAASSRYDLLPEEVRAEAIDAFVNWLGCVIGGCREPAVRTAAELFTDLAGSKAGSVIGTQYRTSLDQAAFLNCMSSSVHAYDDAHLATVTHPSGPIAAGIYALGERSRVTGEEFLNALAVGIEIQCRLGNALVLSPADFNVGFYVTGIAGPPGAAAGLGRLIGLDAGRIAWAMAIAASHASGLRATHGTMSAHYRPGNAARGGVLAALLAERGFDSAGDILEADKGFFDVYTSGADQARALAGLGRDWEMLAVSYKPYPCGIVIHPAIDACLEVRSKNPRGLEIVAARLRVHPLALRLTGKRVPTTTLQSHISLYHWAAAALLRGKAGIAESSIECLRDPGIAALREMIEATADTSLTTDEASVELTLSDGSRHSAHVQFARGSIARPLTGQELDDKFLAQSQPVLGTTLAARLLASARGIASHKDVTAELGSIWKMAG